MNNPNQGHRKRLLQRFLDGGRSSLAEHEFLELILHYAIPQKDTKALAKELIHHYGSFSNVLAATTDDLSNQKGLGPRSAGLLKLIFESHAFIAAKDLERMKSINNPQDVIPYLASHFKGQKKEFFYALFLNTQNMVSASKMISMGTVDQAPVYVREIVEHAIFQKASRVIIAHNHPSGVATPSSADKEITDKIRSALKIMNIDLLDHLIIGSTGEYYSFQENALL